MNPLLQMNPEEFTSFLKDVVREVVEDVFRRQKEETELMDVNEAAIFLNLSVATLYEKTSERTIPHYKHGKKLTFKKVELIRWIEASKVSTVQDLNQIALNNSINLRPRKRNV